MEFVRAGAGARVMYRRPTIYFDWDGTLADSMPLCIAHIRQTLEELGLPPKTNAEMAKCNGPTYQESVQVLGIPDNMAEAYLETRQRVELALVNEWQRLFPGIRAQMLLTWLVCAGTFVLAGACFAAGVRNVQMYAMLGYLFLWELPLAQTERI